MSEKGESYLGCGLLALAIIALFCGFMTATTGNSFYPPLGQFIASFFCDGEVIFYRKSLNFESPIVCVNPTTGEKHGIAILYLSTATVFYGGIYFALMMFGWLLVRVFRVFKHK